MKTFINLDVTALANKLISEGYSYLQWDIIWEDDQDNLEVVEYLDEDQNSIAQEYEAEEFIWELAEATNPNDYGVSGRYLWNLRTGEVRKTAELWVQPRETGEEGIEEDEQPVLQVVSEIVATDYQDMTEMQLANVTGVFLVDGEEFTVLLDAIEVANDLAEETSKEVWVIQDGVGPIWECDGRSEDDDEESDDDDDTE
jgi:hypothetical protein